MRAIRSRQRRSTIIPCLFLYSAIAAIGLGQPSHAEAADPPAAPRVLIDTTPPVLTGVTIAVAAGGDFQSALNAAQPGDVITLQAGAEYAGPFTLPVKSGAGWITVRTSTADGSLPPYGTRITPAHAPLLPKIVSTSTSPALQTAPGAHHYRFVGVEIALGAGVTMSYGLVNLGDGSAVQNAASQVPYAFIFDRVYVHGTATANLQRGFALNSASTAIVNSYIADVHYAGADSQAIGGWNGPGPYRITNNYLEASGENVMFGGADPFIPNLVPSDIEIRGNHFNKPVAWRQRSWTVKNLFELKNARRVLVDGNIFEHNWPQAQNGYAILFTVRNQYGTAPWSTVSDVAFTRNVVRHVSGGVNILGQDDIFSSQQVQRILIQNNLFDDVSAQNWGGSGRLLQLLNGAAHVTFDHNTALQSGDFIVAALLPQVAFVFTNNIVPNNQYGLGGDGCFGSPALCISTYLPGAVVTRNAVVGGSAAAYPSGNFFPTAMTAVGFVNMQGGVYQLDNGSPFRAAGTDGKDLGVDWPALAGAVSGVFSGVLRDSGGSAPDTAPPTVSLTAPVTGAVVAGTVPVTATASGPGGIAYVQFAIDGGAPIRVSSAPFQMSWDTRQSTNGTHVLTATAVDLAGKSSASAPVTVTVSNAVASGALTISSVTASAISSSSATISWTTNVPADSQVQFGTTTAYGLVAVLNTSPKTSHAQVLSGLSPGTLYHYRVLSRDASGTLAASPDAVFTTASASVGVQTSPVTWTALTNVTATGGSLRKSSGCDGCQDAGAASTQSIASGDGYVEFTVAGVTGQRALGLSRGNSGTTIADIDFALMVTSGFVEVREGGIYRTDTRTVAGDRLRVAVTGGKVTYAKNGAVFYTSTLAPAYPLIADAALLTASATLDSVVLVSAAPTSSGGGAQPGGATTPGGSAVPASWTSLVNVTASGGVLRKSGGCDGCQDAGGVSTQAIGTSGGYVEFTVSETTTQRAIGLSRGNSDQTIVDIDFALVLHPGGAVEVRERSVYRSDIRAVTGDRFRVSVAAGKVTYSKNGTVFYTSTATPAYPLLVDTAFLTAGGTLRDVIVSGAQ